MSAFAWDSADAYLFDIDGTLLNTRDGVHYYAFRHAMRDVFGLDANIDGVPVHGNTDIGILRAVLLRGGISEATIAQRLPEALRHMCDEVRQNAGDIRVEICPSVRDLLDHLRAAGKLLGIVSGNLEPIGWAKLSAAGLREYFSFGSFSDRHELRADIFRHGVTEARRRRGEHARVYVVGDTPRDIEAARAVGLPVIAVATGTYPREELAALQPDVCVGCCTELLEA